MKKVRIQPTLLESDVLWMSKVKEKCRESPLWKYQQINDYGDIITILIEEVREKHPEKQKELFGVKVD